MFRFTIRELVLLTLVVALGMGWCLDRNRNYGAETLRWHRRANAAKNVATGEGWTVRWDGDKIDITKPGQKPYFQRFESP